MARKQTRRRQSTRRRQTRRRQSTRRRRQTRRRQSTRKQSGGGWYFNVSGSPIGLRPEVRGYDDNTPPVLNQSGGKRSKRSRNTRRRRQLRRTRKGTRRTVRRFQATNLVNNTFGCRQPVWGASCV